MVWFNVFMLDRVIRYLIQNRKSLFKFSYVDKRYI